MELCELRQSHYQNGKAEWKVVIRDKFTLFEMVTSSYYKRLLIEAKMFITFCKTRRKKKDLLHSLALALTVALILTFNLLANELLQVATMLCGLMYSTYGSATEHKYLIGSRKVQTECC